MATPIQTSRYVERDGLLWSPALGSLGLIAGFTTKAQGSMAGTHHPLEEQARNRAALARRLGFDAVTRAKQVHGRDVMRVVGPLEPWPVADAMWTDTPGVLIGIAAADCVPVLVVDPDGPIGAAHAGWQGTSLRIASGLVEALVAAGADIALLFTLARIGERYLPDGRRLRLIEVVEEYQYTIIDELDLKHEGANTAQLRDAGVARIEVAGICTRSGGAPVWSYRGRGADGKYGTQLGFLGRAR